MQKVKDALRGDHSTTSQSSNHSHTVGSSSGLEGAMAVPKNDVAVGLPDAMQGVATAMYQDLKITSDTKSMPVTEMMSSSITGTDVAMETRQVEVPVTKMVDEVVMVPEVHMETEYVSMPVTSTQKVAVTEKEVVMRDELVTREEVVLDTHDVEKPVTVMKPVETEKPLVVDREVMVARPHEVLKKITVVRPEEVMQDLSIMRPVRRTKMIKVMRPVEVKKMISVEVPVPVSTKINITVPEIRDETVNIEVPHTEQRSVTYQEPVTVIRSAGAEEIVEVVPSTTLDKPVIRAALERGHSDRDWAAIPVGLPFTELVTRAKNFDVTELHTEQTHVRRTWMKPTQYTQLGYKFETRQEEIVTTELQEFEVEVADTVMEATTVQMRVSALKEVTEEWPVSKEHQEYVTTSAVSLEPVTTMVPEIGMKTVQEQVPRTVVHTETIQHPETVERTVMVDQPVTVMREVAVERPVETMREVHVQRPVTTYETRDVVEPVATTKQVNVQEVREFNVAAKDEHAQYGAMGVQYRTAETVMQPTAVHGNVVIAENVAMTNVRASTLAENAEAHAMGLTQQEGVAVGGAELHTGYTTEGVSMTGVAPAAAIAPGAVLEHVQHPIAHTGTHGELVDPKYAKDIRTAMGDGGLIDGDVVGVTDYHTTKVVEVEHKTVQDTYYTENVEDSHMSSESGTPGAKKKGLFGRIKDKVIP